MDMRDVMLEAQAEVQEIVREVLVELAKPQMMAQLKATWYNAPEEVRQAFRLERPQEYAELMEDLKRK